MKNPRILVLEDEPLVAEDIAWQLKSQGFQVAHIARDVAQAMRLLTTETFDAALLDINLGNGQNGIDVADFIHREVHIPFVFVTSHADRKTVQEAIKTHPGGYLVKPFDEKDLMVVLELALSNHMPVSASTDCASANKKLKNALSEREFTLWCHLREGKTNQEIAEALGVTINTIKTHTQHLYEKLDVRNRTEALVFWNRVFGV